MPYNHLYKYFVHAFFQVAVTHIRCGEFGDHVRSRLPIIDFKGNIEISTLIQRPDDRWSW